MVGRQVINDPFYWRTVDQLLYNATDKTKSRREVLEQYASYAEEVEKREGPRCRPSLMKPVLGGGLHYIQTLMI